MTWLESTATQKNNNSLKKKGGIYEKSHSGLMLFTAEEIPEIVFLCIDANTQSMKANATMDYFVGWPLRGNQCQQSAVVMVICNPRTCRLNRWPPFSFISFYLHSLFVFGSSNALYPCNPFFGVGAACVTVHKSLKMDDVFLSHWAP